MFIQTFSQDPQFFLRYVVIIILSICLHELSHGVAALRQGDDTPRTSGHMTMNPMVHMGIPSLLFLCFSGMAWGLMPVNPSKFKNKKYGDMIVSAAGPLMNLAIALVAIVMLSLSLKFSADGIISSEFMGMAAQINLSLCMLNLLPIPPLDGFHVWSTFVPQLKVLQGPYSIMLIVLLFALPGFGRGLAIASTTIIQTLMF